MKSKVKTLIEVAAISMITLLKINANTTYAAKKPSGQIKLGITSNLYNKNGQKIKKGASKIKILDINSKKNAVKKYYGSDQPQVKYGTTLNYYGKPKLIKTSLSTFGYPTNAKDTKAYYNIGGGYYINTKNTSVPTGKTTLTVYRNTTIYNKDGKATKKILKANSTVYTPSKARLINNKKKYYSFYYKHAHKYNWYYIKQRFWIPYIKINGNYYYNLGKNQYIKAQNVSYLTGKEVFVPKATTVYLRKNLHVFSQSGNSNIKTLKKGTKVKVDFKTGLEYHYPQNYHETRGLPIIAYHITGTKDQWIDGDVDDAKAFQKLERDNINQYLYSYVESLTKNKPLQTYNFQGKAQDAYLSSSTPAYSVNCLIYIWNTKTNKAELYYHLTDNLTAAQNSAGNGYMNFNIGDAFIKADSVKYITGLKLKPVNTPQEAENGVKKASNVQKDALTKLINEQKSVRKSIKYKLSNYARRHNYDIAIKNATAAIKDDSFSQNSAQYYQWFIDYAQKHLNGKKVKVKNLNKLTAGEAKEIENIATNAMQNDTTDFDFVHFNSKRTKLIYNGIKNDNKITLSISDYATDK